MLKRLINLTGSVVVRIGDWFSDSVNQLLGRPVQPRCMVLAYHSVPARQRAQFVQQMDMLRRDAKVVHADVDALPEKGGQFAVITFDDGLEDIIDNALPELKKRGMPSTVFVITELLGRKRNWEHRGGEDTSDVKVMPLEQLKELPSELVKIGSHTMTHAFLPSLEKGKMGQEVCESRSRLEGLLNCEVKLFSLPYGAFNDSVLKVCREAGYSRVFTGLPVLALSQPGEFVTGRVVIGLSDWPIEFRLKAAGAYRWLPYAYALKRRIRSSIRRPRREAAVSY